MKLTNTEMSTYVYILTQLAPKTQGRLAYAVAKNIRKLEMELVEYNKIKDKHIKEFGEENEDGVYQIKTNSEEFQKFVEAMAPYDDIESEVAITMVMPDDVYSSALKGDEVGRIMFMIDDEEEIHEDVKQDR